MAHPEHIEPLDGFDRLTIRSYRLGLVLAAVGLGLSALEVLVRRGGGASLWLVMVGVVLSIGNMHLYDKRVRWVLQWLAWTGLLLRGLSGAVDTGALLLNTIGLGLLLAALSGLVLKEWFCFRLFAVRWTPLVLATGVIARYAERENVSAVAFGLAALGVAAVAVAKLSMPLTHDLGDRRHYQI